MFANKRLTDDYAIQRRPNARFDSRIDNANSCPRFSRCTFHLRREKPLYLYPERVLFFSITTHEEHAHLCSGWRIFRRILICKRGRLTALVICAFCWWSQKMDKKRRNIMNLILIYFVLNSVSKDVWYLFKNSCIIIVELDFCGIIINGILYRI